MRKRGKRQLDMRREFGQVTSANEINDLMFQLKEIEETLTPDHQHLLTVSKKMEEAMMRWKCTLPPPSPVMEG